jgi:hypothetical protein
MTSNHPRIDHAVTQKLQELCELETRYQNATANKVTSTSELSLALNHLQMYPFFDPHNVFKYKGIKPAANGEKPIICLEMVLPTKFKFDLELTCLEKFRTVDKHLCDMNVHFMVKFVPVELKLLERILHAANKKLFTINYEPTRGFEKYAYNSIKTQFNGIFKLPGCVRLPCWGIPTDTYKTAVIYTRNQVIIEKFENRTVSSEFDHLMLAKVVRESTESIGMPMVNGVGELINTQDEWQGLILMERMEGTLDEKDHVEWMFKQAAGSSHNNWALLKLTQELLRQTKTLFENDCVCTNLTLSSVRCKWAYETIGDRQGTNRQSGGVAVSHIDFCSSSMLELDNGKIVGFLSDNLDCKYLLHEHLVESEIDREQWAAAIRGFGVGIVLLELFLAYTTPSENDLKKIVEKMRNEKRVPSAENVARILNAIVTENKLMLLKKTQNQRNFIRFVVKCVALRMTSEDMVLLDSSASGSNTLTGFIRRSFEIHHYFWMKATANPALSTKDQYAHLYRKFERRTVEQAARALDWKVADAHFKLRFLFNCENTLKYKTVETSSDHDGKLCTVILLEMGLSSGEQFTVRLTDFKILSRLAEHQRVFTATAKFESVRNMTPPTTPGVQLPDMQVCVEVPLQNKLNMDNGQKMDDNEQYMKLCVGMQNNDSVYSLLTRVIQSTVEGANGCVKDGTPYSTGEDEIVEISMPFQGLVIRESTNGSTCDPVYMGYLFSKNGTDAPANNWRLMKLTQELLWQTQELCNKGFVNMCMRSVTVAYKFVEVPIGDNNDALPAMTQHALKIYLAPYPKSTVPIRDHKFFSIEAIKKTKLVVGQLYPMKYYLPNTHANWVDEMRAFGIGVTILELFLQLAEPTNEVLQEKIAKMWATNIMDNTNVTEILNVIVSEKKLTILTNTDTQKKFIDFVVRCVCCELEVDELKQATNNADPHQDNNSLSKFIKTTFGKF